MVKKLLTIKMKKKIKMKNKNLIVFVGDSGSGKSYYEKAMYNLGFDKLVSHTTRNPRVGEVNSVDYYFVSFEDFDKIDFVETVNIHGNKYGVSIKEIESKNNDMILVAEPNGVEQILQQMEAIVILLDLPKEVRKENMINRGDTIENIEYRLANEDFKGDLEKKGIVPNIIITEMISDINEIKEKIDLYLLKKN